MEQDIVFKMVCFVSQSRAFYFLMRTWETYSFWVDSDIIEIKKKNFISQTHFAILRLINLPHQRSRYILTSVIHRSGHESQVSSYLVIETAEADPGKVICHDNLSSCPHNSNSSMLSTPRAAILTQRHTASCDKGKHLRKFNLTGIIHTIHTIQELYISLLKTKADHHSVVDDI